MPAAVREPDRSLRATLVVADNRINGKHRRMADEAHPSDAEAIGTSLSDPTAFGIVFERHFDTIFGFFARRVPRSEVGDLAAETFRLAFDARRRFDRSSASARPWLYGFARNVLRHHVRSKGRETVALRRLTAVSSPGDGDGDGGETALVDALDAAARWTGVAAALAELEPIDREALLLLAWEDLSYADIAIATGVPVGTVRSRIHRARTRLRELLDTGGQLPINRTDSQKELEHG
jgi:RNA polymerase sigma-70 factor (ECF subfamily)